jgi:hypothetical protein
LGGLERIQSIYISKETRKNRQKKMIRKEQTTNEKGKKREENKCEIKERK